MLTRAHVHRHNPLLSSNQGLAEVALWSQVVNKIERLFTIGALEMPGDVYIVPDHYQNCLTGVPKLLSFQNGLDQDSGRQFQERGCPTMKSQRRLRIFLKRALMFSQPGCCVPVMSFHLIPPTTKLAAEFTSDT